QSGEAPVINSCAFPVYIVPVAPTGQLSPPQLVPAGQTWSHDIQYVAGHGVSLKVSKTDNFAWPIMQFEYTAESSDIVWYNLSFLDCVKGKDASACPGWEYGVQAVCGSGDSFRCEPNEYCDKNGYFIPEGGYLPTSPVKQCKKSGGVTFELCA
ncbi:hypothetical protein K505DRAFT_197820, partial [Melanomma pulvis-pyrius CBS 109.77]